MSSRFCGDKLHNFCFNATFSALFRISSQDDEVDGDDGETVGDDGDDDDDDDEDDDGGHHCWAQSDTCFVHEYIQCLRIHRQEKLNNECVGEEG